MDILIIGMRGLGVEIAKNVVLAGPKSVTIHDDTLVELRDLGANFYLTEEDIGNPRASCLHSKLSALNPYV
eukprot:CAMPEP_0201283252 /NCGR_PEP_ID=MMETSP1317-20130820/8058_1 /ASSEMBLY_ACC=CAM_ASM_000770 /TAXON_ID=187299 /ORGANISM="Undescribed Undescribed, Strain Undescribed" /LENGTH=70 /DNA_ID=CAMNT_0047598873 /DNA_START=118 /DNA_END=330 /DNA_ORIENTATION=-